MWNVHLKQFYSQLKLGFEIVTSTLAVTSMWSPGSSVDFQDGPFLKEGFMIWPFKPKSSMNPLNFSSHFRVHSTWTAKVDSNEDQPFLSRRNCDDDTWGTGNGVWSANCVHAAFPWVSERPRSRIFFPTYSISRQASCDVPVIKEEGSFSPFFPSSS
jgi:hypothetical protein